MWGPGEGTNSVVNGVQGGGRDNFSIPHRLGPLNLAPHFDTFGPLSHGNPLEGVSAENHSLRGAEPALHAGAMREAGEGTACLAKTSVAASFSPPEDIVAGRGIHTLHEGQRGGAASTAKDVIVVAEDAASPVL